MRHSYIQSKPITHPPLGARAILGGCVVSSVLLLGVVGCGGSSTSGATFEQGVELQEAGQWEEAIAVYNAVIAADAEHVGALFNRGVAKLERNDAKGAAADFAAVLALAPDDLDARLWHGSAQLAAGDTDAALADFDAVVNESPYAPEAYALRAQAHRDAGTLDAALADADAAVRLDPDVPAYYDLRAELFDAMDEPEAAEVERSLAAVTRQVVADPDDADARGLRGTAFLVLDEPELALPDLAFAMEKLPDNIALRLTRGQCYASLNKPAEALIDLTAVIDRAGVDAAMVHQARLSRAAVYESRGAYADAIAEYERLREADNGVANSATVRLARLRAGCPEVALRRPSEAVELATLALNQFDARVELAASQSAEDGLDAAEDRSRDLVNPEDRWFYLDTLAAACFADGRTDDAIGLQTEALAAAPEGLRDAVNERLRAYQDAAE